MSYSDVTGLLTQWGVQSGVQLAFIKTGVNNMIVSPSDGWALGGLKKGGLWYLNNELSHLVLGQPNNISNFDLMKLVDDSVFFGLASMAVERTDAMGVVRGLIPIGDGLGADVGEALSVGAIQLGVNYFADNVFPTVQNGAIRSLRNVSQLFK